LRLLVFLFCAALLALGQFGRTFKDSERYGYLADIMRRTGRPPTYGSRARSARSSAASGSPSARRASWCRSPSSPSPTIPAMPCCSTCGRWRPTTAPPCPTWRDSTRFWMRSGFWRWPACLFSLRAYITSIVLMWWGPAEYCRLDGHLAALELHRAGEHERRAADRARGQGPLACCRGGRATSGSPRDCCSSASPRWRANRWASWVC